MNFKTIQAINTALSLIKEESPKYANSFTSTAAAQSYCKLKLACQERELFLVLFLNSQHELIESEIMFKGTIDSAAVYPREIAKASLKHNASAVILAHNHPSGKAEPSVADHSITTRIKNALELIDIRVLDHLVIAGINGYSFAENHKM